MLLLASSGLCVVLQLVHSLYFRPFRATFLILLFCLPVAGLYGGLYDFNALGPTVRLWQGIPIVQVVGFFFAFYCALSIGAHLFERRREDGARVVPYLTLLVATVFITIFIGVGIEYANFVTKWWTWRTYFIDPAGVRHKVIVGKIMLVGVWGWRPLLVMPILLQFFVKRDFRINFRPGWRLLFLAPVAALVLIALLHREKQLHLLVFLCVGVAAVTFVRFAALDMAPLLARILRHREIRFVVLFNIVWFAVFLAWMIFVDRVPVLQYMTLPLWLLLLILPRFKSPDILLDHFQFDRPKPLLRRSRR